MNWLNTILILVVAFLAVFAQSTVTSFRNLTGAQPDLLPGLMVYVSLTSGWFPVALVALVAGLWFDSLSANPIGATSLPLFLVGFVLNRYRGLILRPHLHAQWLLGGAASAIVPLLTLVLILSAGRTPLLGWFSLWQWFVVTLMGSALTPVWFQILDRLAGALNYQHVEQSSFRPDRQIKRGRHYAS
jgi:rod shape-determining protein MreD